MSVGYTGRGFSITQTISQITVKEDSKMIAASAHTNHRGNFIEILYLIEGDTNYFIEGDFYPFEPFDIVFSNATEIHGIVHRASCTYNRIVINLFPEFFMINNIEELADNLGLTGEQRDNFIAAVARYNEMCAAGVDSDFGRDSEVLFPVNEGPFYAVKTTPTIGSTMVTCGGLLTDGEQNVLDANMEPIPGLYASGNCCGRRFGNEYFTPIPGVSIGLAIVLGRECGKSVANFIKSL